VQSLHLGGIAGSAGERFGLGGDVAFGINKSCMSGGGDQPGYASVLDRGLSPPLISDVFGDVVRREVKASWKDERAG
jgi:hypothetical protein